MTINKRELNEREVLKMIHVPVYCVIDGRCFASAEDKAMLDRHCTDRGESLLPVEVVCPAPAASPQFLPLARIGIVA